MEKVITVLKVEPKEYPEVVKLKNNLESLQEAVDGLIEIIDIDRNVCILCNEEGKLNGMAGNRKIFDDIIAGVFYVCGFNAEGDLTSLTDKQIALYKKIFWEPQTFTREEIDETLRFEFIPLNDMEE